MSSANEMGQGVIVGTAVGALVGCLVGLVVGAAVPTVGVCEIEGLAA